MKKTIARRTLLALWILVGPALAYATYFLCTRPLPKPMIIALQIPERAEVRPASAVSPGTFKIGISPEELFDRARTSTAQTLVSWQLLAVDIGERFRVEYWLPRGDSIFFHAILSHPINWPRGIGTSAVEMTRQGALVRPEHGDTWAILGILGLIFYSGTSMMLVMAHCNKRRRARTVVA